MILPQRLSKQSRQTLDLIRIKNGIIFDILVFLIGCLSFVFSWIESSVNLDSHHWGFMYAQALDIKRGLVPHKDALIAYGYLTTWIQGISLSLFGERLISIGIMTSIFYSLSLFLSYRIFLKFLPKYISFFSVCTIFLLHGYIIYPWANYFSYTFELLSLLLFFGETISIKNIFSSGFFLGLSFLCRYSSIPAILPPFCMLLFFNPLLQKEPGEQMFNKTPFFIGGFLTPVILFFLLLIYEGGLSDFFIQNKAIATSFGRISSVSTLIFFPIKLVLLRTIIHDGRAPEFRSFLLTINFFFSLLTLLYFYNASFRKKLSTRENIVLSSCLVTLFGYLNSVHIYDMFRLVNGSSLGIGIAAYVLMETFRMPIPSDEPWKKRYVKTLILMSVFFTYIILVCTLLFKEISSAVVPWSLDILTVKEVKTAEISMFQGKILSKTYSDFYRDVYRVISKFGPYYYIINYTIDPIVAVINDLPRVQFSSFYLPSLAKAYPKESERIQQIINSRKAIILSTKDLQIPGYKVWAVVGGDFYISVPETAPLPASPPSP